MLEGMLKESTGWDHVDYISTSLVGRVLEKDHKAMAYLIKWKGFESYWMRRASLISQIPLLKKGQGDPELFFALARVMIEEKEFFIRKAIGWTVRELSKSDPESARDFLLSVRGRASGLTMREGAKRLPATMRKEVLGR
jgi:3-methyladenine DNA glycosylase AlkD